MKKDLKERFEDKIIPEPMSGCWLWVGNQDRYGYGMININGKSVSTHRVSFSIYKNVIPNKMYVLHKCDNRCCVNPEHLFLGTHKDNMKDMKIKGRAKSGMPKGYLKSHCHKGHELSIDNVLLKKEGNRIVRRCKKCSNKSS